MPNPTLFVIDYVLHGQEKSFVIRLPQLNNAEAWHWACCDAGIGVIPRFGRVDAKKISRPQAEKYGLTQVRWRHSGMAPLTRAAVQDSDIGADQPSA